MSSPQTDSSARDEGDEYLARTREFFGSRAATWDAKFGDDLPLYAAAISEAGIRDGGLAVDVGCGNGRALSALRGAVGAHGTVIGLDVTPEMLGEARTASLEARAALVLADARRVPLGDASADAIFAAGLVNHLPDAEAGLREFARVTRPDGLLILFHPVGRRVLAARRGREITPDEPLSPEPLRRHTHATGWRLTDYEDTADRFYARAVRVPELGARFLSAWYTYRRVI
jgi:SAM-dependent methyltransferase